MPKPLTRPQPTSSIAGMLDQGIAARVIAKPAAQSARILPIPLAQQVLPEERSSSQNPPSGEIPSISRQFTLTPSTDRTLKQLIAVYGEATGLDLKHSELLRAVLVAIAHAMPQLIREAAQIGRLKRPKNDRGNEALRELLERKFALALMSGMRASGAMEP